LNASLEITRVANKLWTVDEWKEYWQKRCVAAENQILELKAQRAEVVPPQRYKVQAFLDGPAGNEYATLESDADKNGAWVKWDDIASQFMNKERP
jgi:hypothetical protein